MNTIKKKDSYGWGIMGAGIIARKMAEALGQSDRCELLVIGSKSGERAESFAGEWNIPRYGSYEDLLKDPEIDVVYVATTHNFHYANAKMALEYGKHLLVEKPFTIHAGEADELIEIARSRGLFLMEAIWTRFLPSWMKIRELIQAGLIGEVRFIDIVFGKIIPPQFEKRLNDPALAGCATLDLGIYPISFCSYIMGEIPEKSGSMSHPGRLGVDETAAYQLAFSTGAIAQIGTSFSIRMDDRAVIYGTRGIIDFSGFPGGDRFRIRMHDGKDGALREEELILEQEENGFVYEVEEVLSCLDRGAGESAVIPLQESRDLMELMDGMRHSWGLVYPDER
jgi:predicted dehydrogenase